MSKIVKKSKDCSALNMLPGTEQESRNPKPDAISLYYHTVYVKEKLQNIRTVHCFSNAKSREVYVVTSVKVSC